MSRLDDQLKIAFRREPAPDGFLEKVLERTASQEAPSASQLGRWKRWLRDWLDFSNWNLAQAVTVAVVLIAIVALGFWTSQRRRVEPPPQQAENQPQTDQQPAPPEKGTTSPQQTAPEQVAQHDESESPIRVRKRPSPHRNQPSRDAEAAKEQVLLALQIASATLGEAQRSVQEGDDRPRSK